MDCLNHLKAHEIRDYLPGCTSTKMSRPETSKIPVMSKESSEIFSKIHQSIPDTIEKFASVKRLDISATEITATLKNIKNLKEYETINKVGSVLTTVAVAVLLIGIIVTCVTVPLLFPGTVAAFLVPFELGILGGGGSIAGLVGCSIWTHDAFNSVPKAKEKLSTQIDEAKVNHEKLKEYFTVNYKSLKQEIESTLDIKKEASKLISNLKGEDNLKSLLQKDVPNLEQALVQLENLHEFYTQSE
jgi:hypothetical protein